MDEPTKKKSRRGFAAMDPKLVSEIARKGAAAAHAAGTAHRWTPEEAKAAGIKGGRASARRRVTKGEIGRCSCGAVFYTAAAAGLHAESCPLDDPMPATERAPEHVS